jgi:2-methylisocitrate lyase-like PEP mutase family enzyme
MHTDFHTRFCDLHTSPQPLLLPNAWDAASASLFQEAGAPAIGTSSASLAWSRGYRDGGALPARELLDAVKGIVRMSKVPVTVDIEDGYSDTPDEVARLAVAIASTGAVGINLEDGAAPPELLARKIDSIRRALAGTALFINARTDVYLRGLASADEAPAMAVQRLQLYREAGADGAFVPGLATLPGMQTVAASVTMPLNVMLVPGLPDVAGLGAAGVKRLSIGPAPFLLAYGHARDAVRAFLGQLATPLLGARLGYAEMNALMAATSPHPPG